MTTGTSNTPPRTTPPRTPEGHAGELAEFVLTCAARDQVRAVADMEADRVASTPGHVRAARIYAYSEAIRVIVMEVRGWTRSGNEYLYQAGMEILRGAALPYQHHADYPWG